MTDGIASDQRDSLIISQLRNSLDTPPFPNLCLPSAFTVAFSCTLEANRGVTRATRQRNRDRERKEAGGEVSYFCSMQSQKKTSSQTSARFQTRFSRAR